MGKQRRQRKKYHIEAKDAHVQELNPPAELRPTFISPMLANSENIFEGVRIDITSINQSLRSADEDTRSVKSFKSLKSELCNDKVMSKKDKLLLRREMFLKKLNAARGAKNIQQVRNKRKRMSIIGDTNQLHDAPLSLESSLKNTKRDAAKTSSMKKKRGIETASKQKKNFLQGIHVYKQIIKDKNFQKDPLAMISEHLKGVISGEGNSQLN